MPTSDTYVAWLRGINLGGKNRLPMKDLSALFSETGCRDVRSYIQSGHIIFKFKADVTTRVGEALGRNVRRTLDMADGPGMLIPTLSARSRSVVGIDLTRRSLSRARELEAPEPRPSGPGARRAASPHAAHIMSEPPRLIRRGSPIMRRAASSGLHTIRVSWWPIPSRRPEAGHNGRRRRVTQGRLLMKRSGVVRLIYCSCVLFLGNSPVASAQTAEPDEFGFIAARPDDLQPPEGSRSVAILGSSREPGMYVTRITFGPGQGTRPHFHDQDRYITVIKGTWWVALGPEAETYNPDEMVPIPAGSFIFEPANGYHYDQARDEEVTVQITGMGPVISTRLEPDANRDQ
jgi:quercetin dioxygenase-like cupin family protein